MSLFLFAFSRTRLLVPGGPVPVSVIICAHDEEVNLRELIPVLLDQDHPSFEVIVVEDRGNDGTYDYLIEATQREDRLKMVRVVHKPEHVTGKKYGLTLGIKAARFDWILLTDADCRPVGRNWLSGMSSYFSNTREIVLGFSSYEKRNSLLNAFIRFETFLTAIQYIGFSNLGWPYMGVGRNLAYRKSLFLDNKGFNNHLSLAGGDDDLFVNRHATRGNTVAVYDSDTLVYSKPKESWKEFYYQKLRHLFAGKKYNLTSRLLLGLFSVSWIGVWFVAVPVAIIYPSTRWLLVAIAVRWILLIWLFAVVPRKLGDRFEVWKVLVLDFIYAFYYLVAGMAAAVTKKVKWRV